MPDTITDWPTDPEKAILHWREVAMKAESLQADYIAARAHAYLTPPEGADEKWTDGKREAYSKSSTKELLAAAAAAAVEAEARKEWMRHILGTHPGYGVLDLTCEEAISE